MPFGLQLKSIIVGLLLGWFGVPWIMSFFAARSAAPATV